MVCYPIIGNHSQPGLLTYAGILRAIGDIQAALCISLSTQLAAFTNIILDVLPGSAGDGVVALLPTTSPPSFWVQSWWSQPQKPG